MSKVWFITGASRGFGREWSLAALERGDSVAATARDTAALGDLVAQFGDRVLPLALDVTDRAGCFEANAAAVARWTTRPTWPTRQAPRARSCPTCTSSAA